ncbi:MAG: hypothetical protein IJT87_13210 [Ruminiclostridium sp.]|nr:hypothetical protein [Ruminiclostridium sp.]
MKSIIEKLYYGEISPCAEPTPTTKKYIDAKEEIEQLELEILAKYPNCKELLEKYTDAIHVASAYESLADFARGFKLGAEFMIAIYDDTN